MNRELLATSIIASGGVVLVFIFNQSFLISNFLLILGLVFSYFASINRYITPVGFILSLVPLVFTKISLIYLISGLSLGLISLVIPWIWELIIIIIYGVSLLFPSVIFISSQVFQIAIFSSLGFANIRASTGKGYPAIVKVIGLPNMPWYTEVNGVLRQINSNILRDKSKIELRLCPQFLSGYYYIPESVTVTAKQGEKKIVKFSQSNTVSPDKFPHCFGYFYAKGLPSNISWSVIVNNVEYSSQTNSVIIVPMFNILEAIWNVKDIVVGNVIFKPITYTGIIKRGNSVTIEYTSYVTQVVQQTKPILPPLNKWDPNLWVGKDLYGYKIVSVIGIGGNGYVLKAEKDNVYYAIKVFSLFSSNNAQITLSTVTNFDQMFKESETLKSLSQNPKFVRIYGFYIDSNNIKSILKGNVEAYYNYPPTIVMEYMEGGTADQLMTNQNVIYSNYWPLIVKEIVKEIAYALESLHSNGFVHLDVKPENIFFSRNLGKYPEEVYRNIMGSVKLGDLGSSVRKGERFSQATPSYCPPEQIEAVIVGKGADPKMDIFALGMTAYTLLSLRKNNPIADHLNKAIDFYLSGNVGEAYKLIQTSKQILASWRPTLPPNTPNELANVVFRSLSVNPDNRPSASEIANMLK
ncbi:serine/threonine-protein kinase [Sulfurisphaera javensis]|uniref:Serine/threonine-protein kinase n=1 Tax=Sulfurisphaera javensis TaxID=2049879 RepID=A0AAT9GT13_9CREN